jgi:hypothetical protein
VTDTANRVEVARVGAEHLPALAEFYRQVWDPQATPESVRVSREQAGAVNPVIPGESPPTWIVLREDRAIGHVTTIPLRLWLNEREQGAYWIKGLWVLPEFQRSAVGFLVLKTAVQQLQPARALALAHEPAALRLFGALGFTDLGGLPNELRVLNTGRFLARVDLDALSPDGMPRPARRALQIALRGARLAAPVAAAAVHLWSRIATGPTGSLSIAVAATLDHRGAEELWQAARSEILAGPCRGSDQLAARYADQDDYMFVHVRDRERLVGLGVVKRPHEQGDPRLRGIRIATLSDLLYHPTAPRAGLAVLRGAERAASSMAADALLAGASAAALRPLTRRRGFLPVPANLHVLARVSSEQEPFPARLDQWWVTRGDSGGDGVF